MEIHRYGEPAVSSTAIVLEQLEEQGQAMLKKLGGRADNAGIECSWGICHGRPWEEALDAAHEASQTATTSGINVENWTATVEDGEIGAYKTTTEIAFPVEY